MSSNVDQNASDAEEQNQRSQHNKFIRQGHSWSGNERNCLFLNQGGSQFSTASYVTGFDFKDDSRGIALVDWDHDGDLDIWMSNRHSAQARYLENQLENSHWVSLKLKGNGKRVNLDAIGTTVLFWIQENGKEVPLKRDVHCSGSFLSQSSRWVNVGLGEGTLNKIEVIWPDGTQQEFRAPAINKQYTLNYGDKELQSWQRPSAFQLSKKPLPEPNLKDIGTRLIYNYPLPPLPVFSSDEVRTELSLDKIQVLHFWSADCTICESELKTMHEMHAALKAQQIGLTLINVDIYASGKPISNKAQIDGIPEFSTNAIGIRNIERFIDIVRTHHATFSTPLSLLLDKEGNIISFYEGKMEAQLIIRDAQLAQNSRIHRHWNTIPFKGVFNGKHVDPMHDIVASEFMDFGYINYAEKVLEKSSEGEKNSVPHQLELAAIYLRTKRPEEAIPLLQSALEKARMPNDLRIASRNLGLAYLNTRQYELAEQQLAATAKTHQDAQSYYYLAKTVLKLGRGSEVEGHLLKSIQLCEKQKLAFPPPFKSLASAYKRAGRNLELQDVLARAKALGINLQRKQKAQ